MRASDAVPAPPDGIALQADGLTRRFVTEGAATTALDDVTLKVRPGQVTGLVGPDGAGKTTFMRLACGLLRADAGTLRVMGIDVAADPVAVQAEVRYMPSASASTKTCRWPRTLSFTPTYRGCRLQNAPPATSHSCT